MIFIDACLKKPTLYTPVWMMRQAGRYLPEYMAVRARAGDFLSLCKDYQKAAEVSLQPVEILGVDAAIIFSDILVVPLEMGIKSCNSQGGSHKLLYDIYAVSAIQCPENVLNRQ